VATIVPAAATLLVGIVICPVLAFGVDYPQATISNGQITAKVYLPDAKNGYYRSTRFDWSGAVYSLLYKGHSYYGPWFEAVDPTVINWVFRDGKIVSGPCSALMAPVDEFQTVLGWDKAQVGGTFIKIGVGVLRKEGSQTYNRYYPYPVIDSGKWTVKIHKDSIEFQQVLSDPELGYGYVYRKVMRLMPGKPEMMIKRSLRNTGQREISSSVYDHNFTVLDGQAPGPDFTFEVPFPIHSPHPPKPELAQVKGNQVVYRKELSGEDQVAVPIEGFGDTAKDTEIIIENRKVGAGVRITGNRPLIRDLLWSIRTVLADEPYIAIDVQPDSEFTWENTFDYYTMPRNNR
jgi:hypothetical protein